MHRMPRSADISRALYFLLLACIPIATFYILWTLLSPQPLSHDEAVYLTKARSWIDGSPANQWGVYRPIAMSAIGWILLQFGDSETLVRMFGVAMGALLPLVVFLLFREITNLWIAAATTAIVATSSVFLQFAPLFYNDIPSTLVLLTILWLFYIHYRTQGESVSIYLVAPLAGLAFYLRYGAATSLALIAIFTYLVLLQKFLKLPNPQFGKLGKTILITIALFIPHIIHSIVTTREIFGIINLAGKAAGREYLGQGLAQYFSWLPDGIGGWPIGIAAILGLFTYIGILFNRNLRSTYFPLVWIGGIGLSSFLVTGLLTHGETRYVFFPMVLLAGTGIAGVNYLLERLFPPLAYGAAILAAVVALYFGNGHIQQIEAFNSDREQAPLSIAYTAVHEAIRNDRGDSPCSLWEVQFQPRASWYAGCTIFDIRDVAGFRNDYDAHPDDKKYSIVHTRIREPQITPETADRFGMTLSEIFRTDAQNVTLVVYRISPKETATSTATTSPNM